MPAEGLTGKVVHIMLDKRTFRYGITSRCCPTPDGRQPTRRHNSATSADASSLVATCRGCRLAGADVAPYRGHRPSPFTFERAGAMLEDAADLLPSRVSGRDGSRRGRGPYPEANQPTA